MTTTETVIGEKYDLMVEKLAGHISHDTNIDDSEVNLFSGWDEILRALHDAGYSVTHDVTVEEE